MVTLKEIKSLDQLHSQLELLQFKEIGKAGGRKFTFGDSNISLNTFIRKVEHLCRVATPEEKKQLSAIIAKIHSVDAEANLKLTQRVHSGGKGLKFSLWWRNSIGKLIYNKENHLAKLTALANANSRVSSNSLTVDDESSLKKEPVSTSQSSSVAKIAENILSTPVEAARAEKPSILEDMPKPERRVDLAATRAFEASALTRSLQLKRVGKSQDVDLTRSLPQSSKKRKTTKEPPRVSLQGSMTKKEEAKLKAVLDTYTSNKPERKKLFKRAKARQFIDHTNFFRGSSEDAVQATKNQWAKGLSEVMYKPWDFNIGGVLESVSEFPPHVLLLMEELPRLTKKVAMSPRVQQASAALYEAAEKVVVANKGSSLPGIRSALEGVLVSFLQTQVTPSLDLVLQKAGYDAKAAAVESHKMVVTVTRYFKEPEQFAKDFPGLKVQLDDLSKALLPDKIL